MGGYYRINLQTIKNTKTFENFSAFFKPLIHFDEMINGTQYDENSKPHIADHQYSMLEMLIKHKVNNIHIDIHPYIIDTFEAFTNNKKEIILNLSHIYQSFEKISSLIMGPMSRVESANDKNINDEQQRYSEKVVEEMVNFGLGTYDECIVASQKTINYWDINDVTDTLNTIKDKNESVATRNMLKDIVFSVFKNVSLIAIYSTDHA
eukprot:23919_1